VRRRGFRARAADTDKLPKRLEPEAKDKIHQIWMAPTKLDADKAFDLFVATYEAKYGVRRGVHADPRRSLTDDCGLASTYRGDSQSDACLFTFIFLRPAEGQLSTANSREVGYNARE
jgi:hypothetical protein